MIQAKMAKSRMECSEGMNHLWIHLNPTHFTNCVNFNLHLSLPKGVSAHQNLNFYPEDNNHTVALRKIMDDTDLIFELYTEETLPLKKLLLTISLSYTVHKKFCKETKQLPLIIVPEGISEEIETDQEVVSLVKRYREKEQLYQKTIVSSPPVIQKIETSHALEKKYRIDGCYEAFL